MADISALRAIRAEQPQSTDQSPTSVFLQSLADTNAKREEQISTIYRIYQSNINASEGHQTKLLQGLKQKENPYVLLEIALDCIGKMVNNTVFWRQAEEELYRLIGEDLEKREGYWLQLEKMKKVVNESSQDADSPFIGGLEQIQEYLAGK